MNDTSPFLLLRARPRPDVDPGFDAWFRSVHLRDVAKIPGIVGVRGGKTAAGTRIGIYRFESAEAVQPSLASPQAAYARGTWEQWSSQIEELMIEIYAPLFPLPIYQSRS